MTNKTPREIRLARTLQAIGLGLRGTPEEKLQGAKHLCRNIIAAKNRKLVGSDKTKIAYIGAAEELIAADSGTWSNPQNSPPSKEPGISTTSEKNNPQSKVDDVPNTQLNDCIDSLVATGISPQQDPDVIKESL